MKAILNLFAIGLMLSQLAFAAPNEAPSATVPTQTTTTAAPASTQPPLQEEDDSHSPRASIEGFLHDSNNGNYQRAAQYLDFRNLPAAVAEQPQAILARQLKVILDRTLWIDLATLSVSNEGHHNDGLPSYRDSLGKITLGDRRVSLYVQRIPAENGKFIWKISNASVALIPELYAEHGDGPIASYIANHIPNIELAGMQSWQIALLGLIIMGAYIVTWPLFYLTLYLINRHDADSKTLQRFISGPIRLLVMVLIIRHQFHLLRPSIETQQFAQSGTLLTIAFCWLILSGLELIRANFYKRLTKAGKDQGALLLRPLFTVLKILIIIFSTLSWLENLGYQATTILAGLGIGGLAVALAAQKSVENLIAAVTLYISAPVKAGDFCKFGPQFGVVEEIGLRFTRIRTLDRTIINVPNATFVDLHIENYSVREKIRFSPAIKLRLDSQSEQIKQVLQQITQLLNEHPMVDSEPVRVRLNNFGTYALELNILCYLTTVEFEVYLEHAEQLNLQIMKILEANEVYSADIGQYRLVNQPS